MILENKQEEKFRQMTEPPVSSLICKLAVPCIISMLVTSFYNMADTYFVGMLKSNAATGAVGVVFSMMAIIQAIGFFFGHGSGNYISRQLGEKNYDEASKMAATGFYTALATGAVICILGQLFLDELAYLLGSTETILPYTRDYLRIILLGAPWMAASLVLNNQLRFQGSANYAMIGIVTGAVLNIALDPLLIFTFDMGVAGAGWATIISQFVSFCLLLVGCSKGSNIAIRFSNVRLRWFYFKMINKRRPPVSGPPESCFPGYHLSEPRRRPLRGCRHRRHGCCTADHHVRRFRYDRLWSGFSTCLRFQFWCKAL